MSTLGFVSGHLEREQQLLRELNSALLAQEAEALGRASDLGFSEEDVSKSRQILGEFVIRLRAALDQETTTTDIQSLVHRIKSGMKPLEDWREDLDALTNKLQTIVEVASRSIKELLPNAKRYEVQVPNGKELEQIPENTALEDILNRAAMILMTRPEQYADWEKKVFEVLDL